MAVNDRIWLPAGAERRDTPKVKRSDPASRAFEKLANSIRSMGFECKWRVDRKELVVEVEFIPTNDKMRQAVKIHAGSSQATALRVAQAFGVLDDERQVVLHCVETGLEELRQL